MSTDGISQIPLTRIKFEIYNMGMFLPLEMINRVVLFFETLIVEFIGYFSTLNAGWTMKKEFSMVVTREWYQVIADNMDETH